MSRLVFIVGLLLLAACGGSSSETPWPREPDDVDLGPAGERETEEAPFRAGERSSEASPAGPGEAPSPSR